MDLKPLLDTMTQIVHEAGPIAHAHFGHAAVLREKAFGDFATEGDVEVEEFLLAKIQQAFPGHTWDSEECGRGSHSSDFVWIIDPIDGTKYYSRGIPLYTISVALEHRRQLVLGVVYNPETGDTYSAATGLGASCSGWPIRCSTIQRLDEAMVCLEIPSRDSPEAERRWALPRIAHLIDHTRRVRILGVGALGMCYCAAGSLDVYVNLNRAQKYCDTAAGRVILTEAGGRFFPFGPRGVGGPPQVCQELIELLQLD